jgi:hypothetical protein
MPRIELSELERQKLAKAGADSIPYQHGWRSIDTAPKDGTHIWIWNDGGMDIYWYEKSSHSEIPNWINKDGWRPAKPTLWQPLPQPPLKESE